MMSSDSRARRRTRSATVHPVGRAASISCPPKCARPRVRMISTSPASCCRKAMRWSTGGIPLASISAVDARNCFASDHSRAGPQKKWLASKRSISSEAIMKKSRIEGFSSSSFPIGAGSKNQYRPPLRQSAGRLAASELVDGCAGSIRATARSPAGAAVRYKSPRRKRKAAPSPDVPDTSSRSGRRPI